MTGRKCLIIIILLVLPISLFSQKDRKYIRDGVKKFNSENFEESEISFRKAQELAKDGFTADFNIGDALFRQEKFEEAGKRFEKLSVEDSDKFTKASVYHNLGNSLLLNQKLEESIEAYKNALRNNPRDLDTKYNLAYAQNLLKKQQEQEQNQDQEQNEDKKEDQDKKDKEDQNKKDDQQEQKDQQNKEDQKDTEKEKQSQKISKEDAQRLLEALANDEKKVQEKVNKAKALQKKVRTMKEW